LERQKAKIPLGVARRASGESSTSQAKKNRGFQTRTGSSLEDVEGQEESGSLKEMSSALRRSKIDSLPQQASAKESAKV
jgi:hypothetical protein